jgi:poly(3-hydroxybutyrate) depolymerase
VNSNALTCFMMVMAIGLCANAASTPKSAGEYEVAYEVPVEDYPSLNYLLQLPEGYSEDGEPWPLILFLHGGGERGEDLSKVKAHGPPKLAAADPSFPFVVVSPQCDLHARWPHHIYGLKSLLDEVLEHHNVDRDRIYCTGLSLGGEGTWNLAMVYPELFAAIAPMASGGMEDEAARLWDLPIWAFHGEDDGPDKAHRIANAARRTNENVKLTVYPDTGHDCWTRAYEEEPLFDWFLSHTRKRPPVIATASENSADARFAIDNNPETRWRTETPATRGQWIQIDFGRVIHMEGVVLDARGAPDELARGFRVSLSNDGETWDRLKTVSARGIAPRELIGFGQQRARYLKIEQMGSDVEARWSINELDIHYN